MSQDKWNKSDEAEQWKENKPESIRIAGVVRESIVDGPGIRFVVFGQGCPHHCEGCHNPNTHDFDGGYDCSIEKILTEMDKNPLLSGITFSGGEPMCQPEAFLALAEEIKKRKLDIVVYSGYTLEELTKMGQDRTAIQSLLDKIDYLIDGRFVLSERDLQLNFRGSRNQRYIDMAATRQNGKIILVQS
ncbi:anaerobic ribonucleoside-triphosphate reductase activating protein [Clostridium aminobutyricum]|uniref:Anaerobic ribonucleoside-triphosphate reductase-activating protein n=1 Tax=Clostridium aminobutyricum TaxID=33953 RepID=A0A939D7L8_CLOAM|nr:anaerobic ribonucleoside-triphosphate reductase activating protein [Clostridium aminobutyricum]MBN7772575.1 anaerobic ribonucleoside-triphosphate reductase activating protein [Clostridium aminobutyricum]